MRLRPVRFRVPLPLILPLLAAWLLAAALLAPAGGRAGEPAAPSGGAGGPPRLGPTDAAPTFERVDLTLDSRQPDYKGTVQIDLRAIRPTTVLHFHAEDMKIATMVLRGPHGPVPLAWEVGRRGYVTATAPAPIQPGAYTLAIEFTQKFNTQAVGLYRLESGGEAYAFTQFESDDARRAFPCWDEPAFKIPFQVTVHVPEAHLAVSNSSPERVSRANGWKTVVFRKTRPLPSYLVAIATGPFESVEIKGMSVPGRVIAPKGETALTGVAAEMAPRLLPALERYFGRPYPYEKLDLIAVPEFWPGAMENPGAITFRDDALLLDSRLASVSIRRQLARFMAHEFAHQWFGDLVTMKWWDDLWLNESFAEWMGDKIADQVYPDLQVGLGTLGGREAAFGTDAKLATRAIRQPVTTETNLLQTADELAYFKGQSVLGMFERWVGPDAFRRGVMAYLKKHEWGNAEAADLWNELSAASGKDVAGPLATFLDQGGVPIVTADLLPDGRVTLSQRRFLNAGVAAPQELHWKIPVALKYSDGKTTRAKTVLLEERSMTVTLDAARPPAWIHPNADEAGYYRWDVGPKMLQTLAENAPLGLDTRERIGFIDNAGGLIQAGILHGDAFLRILNRFSGDPDPEVVNAVIGHLDGVRFAVVTPDLVPAFFRYVRATLAPALKRYGLSRKPGEAEAVSLARPALLRQLADYGGDEVVLAYADSLAARYLAEPASVDPSLVGTALDLSALRGDQARFDAYRKRFETATNPADRSRFLEALGWFRDPKIVDQALDYILTGPLKPQDLFSIPTSVGRSIQYEGRPWTWLKEHYEAFSSRLPEAYRIYLPYFASGCSAQRLEEARAFFADPSHQAPGQEREFAKMAEGATDCVSLREREGAAVAAYLNDVVGTR
jgi:alanyl aminopeptidase